MKNMIILLLTASFWFAAPVLATEQAVNETKQAVNETKQAVNETKQAVNETKPVVNETKQIVIETNYGDIRVELDKEKAPLSVANFLTYADSNHYNGTIFHRVIKDFMIQGGNFTPDMSPKQTLGPIKNEADNGLRNLRGTLAMARTGVVDSATSQFFINLKDNAFLDHKDNTVRGFGYAVFGKVVEGMDVVDKIGSSPTQTFNRFRDVPAEPVVIKSIKRLAD